MAGKTNNNVNRSNKFLKDIGIYAIGNLGSKLVTFLLVPLYTYFISPSEYGYYDLCFSVAMILLPVLCLQLFDGSFRFLIDANDAQRRKSIVTFVYKSLARNSIIALTLTIIVAFAYPVEYLWYLCALLIVMSFYEVIIQVVRGLGYSKYYVAAGIISALTISVFSVVFIVLLKMGVAGIFLANIFGRLSALVFIEYKLHIIRKYFRFKINDKAVNKEILKYCLPLLPGTICWWLVGSSNKFFIEHFLGLQENGLYAVGVKFASILQVIAYIFYQAWQENALRQYHSSDRDKFFSSVFNNYFYVLSFLVMIFPFGLKLNYGWLVDNQYYDSVKYLYPLAVSAMFFSLAAFYDMGYQCSKRTARTLPGIFLAAIVNTIGNYYLIIHFQVYGIITSSILTFAVLYVYRAIDTRKFFHISISRKTIFMMAIVVANGFVFYCIDSITLIAIYLIALTAALVYFAPSTIINIVTSKIKHK